MAPALFTSTSSFGTRSSTSPASRWISAWRVRSAARKWAAASPCRARSRSTTAPPRTASRPTTSTRAPRSASASAVSRPIPAVAPVTRHVLPVMGWSSRILSHPSPVFPWAKDAAATGASPAPPAARRSARTMADPLPGAACAAWSGWRAPSAKPVNNGSHADVSAHSCPRRRLGCGRSVCCRLRGCADDDGGPSGRGSLVVRAGDADGGADAGDHRGARLRC